MTTHDTRSSSDNVPSNAPPPQCDASIVWHNRLRRCGFPAGHDGSHRVEGGGVRWTLECPHCGETL